MKYQDLVSVIESPVFSRNDLLLAGQKLYDYQLSLWVKKGYLIRLKGQALRTGSISGNSSANRVEPDNG